MSESKRGGAQLARAVEKAYRAGQDDYHLEPMVLVENGKPVGKIGDGDAAVFCCRRGEREIELTELFTDGLQQGTAEPTEGSGFRHHDHVP